MAINTLAQQLDALLTVAESLEGTLPGKTDQEKKQADLNKIFVRIHGNEISFERKNLLNRLFHPDTTYSVEKNFSRLNALYNSIHGSNTDQLQKALRELQGKGLHTSITNPVDALLMYKYRLNAILTHVAHQKNQVDDLSRYKITWMPATSGSLHSMQTRHGHLRIKKSVVHKEETPATPAEPNLRAKPVKSALKKGVSTTKFQEPKWMSVELSCTLNDLKTKKRVTSKEFSNPLALKRLFYEVVFESTRVSGTKGIVEALKKLPKAQREQFVALCGDSEFKIELSRIVTLDASEWNGITQLLSKIV